MATRPADEAELQKREAVGVIRASRFIRVYAKSKKPIDISTIQKVHHIFFQNAWPEIAGVWRVENLEITGSKHHPPHFSHVPGLMKEADTEFVKKLTDLKSLESMFLEGIDELTDEQLQQLDAVVDATAWIHHKITYVHPFREGNGRTARVAANLILERYGLVGISIKIERENKNRYLQSLEQIDQHGDYELLKMLIYEGLNDRYLGVTKNIIG